MKKLLFYLLLLLVFTSCDKDDHYPKVRESISIENMTDTMFVVDAKLIRNLNAPKNDTVWSTARIWFNIDENSYDIWLTEKQFNTLIPALKIYRIEGNDTLFVDKKYYNNLKMWDNEFYRDDWLFSIYYYNSHRLKVTPAMFVKKATLP
ncbi:MAG: hypothetical protein Q7U47_08235 [Paludibacter sp.]|nr:hypothetical protein [Paludibacter sp.]